MKKLLTIVIPSYNVEQYLNKGLATMADERFNHILEVIIINDGSKDSTEELATEWASKYPQIFHVINKENGGHGSVINTGIEHAKGKYFRIIDGDDWVITDNLYELLKSMEDLEVDIVVDVKRDVDMTTLEGDRIPLPTSIDSDKKYKFDNVNSNEEVIRYFMIHNFSVKTELLRENNVKVLEKVFYEDSEYVLKAIACAKDIIFKDIEVYQYMVGNVNQSVSTTNFIKRYSHFDMVTKAMLEFTELHKNSYTLARTKTVILTQYYIALIYNDDRKQGKEWAKELSQFLKQNYKEFYDLTKKRYVLDKVMHSLGINYDKLQTLRKLAGK